MTDCSNKTLRQVKFVQTKENEAIWRWLLAASQVGSECKKVKCPQSLYHNTLLFVQNKT